MGYSFTVGRWVGDVLTTFVVAFDSFLSMLPKLHKCKIHVVIDWNYPFTTAMIKMSVE